MSIVTISIAVIQNNFSCLDWKFNGSNYNRAHVWLGDNQSSQAVTTLFEGMDKKVANKTTKPHGRQILQPLKLLNWIGKKLWSHLTWNQLAKNKMISRPEQGAFSLATGRTFHYESHQLNLIGTFVPISLSFALCNIYGHGSVTVSLRPACSETIDLTASVDAPICSAH